MRPPPAAAAPAAKGRRYWHRTGSLRRRAAPPRWVSKQRRLPDQPTAQRCSGQRVWEGTPAVRVSHPRQPFRRERCRRPAAARLRRARCSSSSACPPVSGPMAQRPVHPARSSTPRVARLRQTIGRGNAGASTPASVAPRPPRGDTTPTSQRPSGSATSVRRGALRDAGAVSDPRRTRIARPHAVARPAIQRTF